MKIKKKFLLQDITFRNMFYFYIKLLFTFKGYKTPKSISSIEKNTLDPIVETKDLYLGIIVYSSLEILGGTLEYP